MKKLHPEKGLRIFDIKWEVKTAGPSPNDNKRIEVFLLGCKKAMDGNPCKGCFNSVTWNKSIAEWSRDPIEVADMIIKRCDPDNKYITIGGGEPTDQLEYLIPLVKKLKENGFHILMYTWRNLREELIAKPLTFFLYGVTNPKDFNRGLKKNLEEIMKYLDIIVDGEFILEEKLWNPKDKNVARNFIGSGNQIIWDIPYKCGYALRDIKSVNLIDNDDGKDMLYYQLNKNIEDCEIYYLT